MKINFDREITRIRNPDEQYTKNMNKNLLDSTENGWIIDWLTKKAKNDTRNNNKLNQQFVKKRRSSFSFFVFFILFVRDWCSCSLTSGE